ncbi:electron transport complex subunit RsxC [candidate division NPL-UPA2 bacterium]|nr:electron transport complex subunit RsxC [candidate division NPL-UPA2 bacterium]
MKILTFPGGVHPPTSKEATRDKKIEPAKIPERVIIPLLQHTGAPGEALVSKGDRVTVGQKIGEAKAFVSAPVHATISGEVIEIKPLPYPLGLNTDSIVIQSDGKDEWLEVEGTKDWKALSPDKIRETIREAGIVGLGGAAFPTHVKLSPPEGKKIDAYILNGAECEPYLTCDYRLMVERPKEILEGFRILMAALSVKNGYIGIEDNKREAISAMGRELNGEPDIQMKVLKTKYPQGGEKQLIKAILRKEVPSGGLPFDVGVLVSNVGTAFSCWEAVVSGKPLVERVITVTGPGVKEPKNLRVRIGTRVSDLIEACGGFNGKPGKIIMGGPMMGLTQFTDEVPVIKGTSGILVQTDVLWDEEIACIRCGKCIQSCPLYLMPTMISLYSKRGRLEEAKDYGALDCIECGACGYTCPARIPLVQWIKYAKRELAKKKAQ